MCSNSKNRALFYRGYSQCLVDLFNILKEQEDITDNKIYLDTTKMGEVCKSLHKRIDETSNNGYMYYDEEQKKFVYIDEEFEDL